jgi:predicted Zn-dependent protease
MSLTQAYGRLGDHDRAVHTGQQLVDQAQRAPLFVGLLANVLARAGRVAEAASLLQELEQRSQTEYVIPSSLLGAAWFLGKHEKALAAADLCIADRTAPFSLLATLGPYLEEFEGDARFAAPFRAMQLPGWT